MRGGESLMVFKNKVKAQLLSSFVIPKLVVVTIESYDKKKHSHLKVPMMRFQK